MAHDVFISHSSRDKVTADAVCGTLEARRIKCWIAPRDITGGEEYGSEIISAIKGSRIMVVIFSGFANSSRHVKREVERAVSHGVTVIPLRIEDVVPDSSLEYFIGSIHWLDALTPPLEKHIHNLAQKIKILLDKTPQANLGDSMAPMETAFAPRPTLGERISPWLTRDVLIGGVCGIVGLVILGFIITDLMNRKPPGPKSPENKNGGTASATEHPQSAPTASAGPTGSAATFAKLTPKKAGAWIVDSAGAADSDARDLPAVMANVSANDVVTIRPGTYGGGFRVTKPVRITGATGSRDDVLIEANGGDTISVTARGAVLENVRVSLTKEGDGRALICEGGTLQMTNCLVQSRSTFGVVITSGSVSATNCRMTTFGTGSAVQAEGAAFGRLSHCTILNNHWGVASMNKSRVRMDQCLLRNNGLPNGRGATASVTGAQAILTIEQCEFTENPASILATEGAQLTMTGCSLKNNGVSGEGENSNGGLMSVNNQAKADLTDLEIESNHQGIAVENGGILQLTRCKLIGNGIRTDNRSLNFYCNTIAANGEGSSVTMTSSLIADAVLESILIDNGASAKIVDSTIRNGSYAGMTVGFANTTASRAELVEVKFIGNHTDGLDVLAGSNATVRNGEFTNNRTCGIALQNFNTTVTASNIVIRGSAEYGVCVYNQAEASVSDSTFEDNGRGAQAGVLATPAGRAILTLSNCYVTGSHICGIAVCTQASLFMKGCRFSNNRNQNVWSERGAIVRQGPTSN